MTPTLSNYFLNGPESDSLDAENEFLGPESHFLVPESYLLVPEIHFLDQKSYFLSPGSDFLGPESAFLVKISVSRRAPSPRPTENNFQGGQWDVEQWKITQTCVYLHTTYLLLFSLRGGYHMMGVHMEGPPVGGCLLVDPHHGRRDDGPPSAGFSIGPAGMKWRPATCIPPSSAGTHSGGGKPPQFMVPPSGPPPYASHGPRHHTIINPKT